MSSKGTPGDRYSDEEADRRMNEAIGRALDTPPTRLSTFVRFLPRKTKSTGTDQPAPPWPSPSTICAYRCERLGRCQRIFKQDWSCCGEFGATVRTSPMTRNDSYLALLACAAYTLLFTASRYLLG